MLSNLDDNEIKMLKSARSGRNLAEVFSTTDALFQIIVSYFLGCASIVFVGYWVCRGLGIIPE